MDFNFERLLFYAAVITGLYALFDILVLAPKRKRGYRVKMPLLSEYARSFFPILLIVFLLRSFVFEPFRIPTGSLEPSLLIGDFILINKFDYGLRMPITHQRIIGSGKPKRGDIMVFRWPPDPEYNFIKRVIGLPGDRISYENKTLTINGQKIPQNYLNGNTETTENQWRAILKEEDLSNKKHLIYVNDNRIGRDYPDIIVPKGMYFVMGDNRDDSADGRYWGFVADDLIIGKASMILFSWDKNKTWLRGNRFLQWVN